MGNYEALNNRLIRQSARHLAIEVGLGIWVVRVCVHLSLCMYVPMCTCVGVDAQFPPHTHTHSEIRRANLGGPSSGTISQHCLFFFFPLKREFLSISWSSLVHLGCLISNARNPPASTSQTLRLQAHYSMLSCLCCCKGCNSGSRTCRVST